MTNLQRITIKNDVLKCSYICGGISDGVLMDFGCDDDLIRELCESKRLKKIPVQIRLGDGTNRKITMYEDVNWSKSRSYSCMTEPYAAIIWERNQVYMKYKDIAVDWFDDSMIATHCNDLFGKGHYEEKPGMMFYDQDGLVGVFFDRKKQGFSDEERQAKIEKYKLDKCLVCISH